MKKISDKRIGAKLNLIYGANFNRVTVPIMSIPKIYAAGKAAFLAGKTDEEIAAAMAEIVNQVKVA